MGGNLIAQTVEPVANAKAPAVDYSPLVIALEQSGVGYEKVNANVWSVPMETKKKLTYKLDFIATQDIISLVVNYARVKGEIKPDLQKKLSELNRKYFFIKYIYDDSSLYMRIDTLLADINANTVRRLIYIVNSAVENDSEDLLKLVPKLPEETSSPKDGAPAGGKPVKAPK